MLAPQLLEWKRKTRDNVQYQSVQERYDNCARISSRTVRSHQLIDRDADDAPILHILWQPNLKIVLS